MLATHKGRSQHLHRRWPWPVGVGMWEQRLRRAPIHAEEAGGHHAEKPELPGLVLRAGVDGEERHGRA
jgi:hypothetical protein